MATSKTKTTTARTTSQRSEPKSATAAKPAPKPTVKPVEVDAAPQAAIDPAAPPQPLRQKEFLARVVQRAGLRPGKIKPVMNAVLAELGDVITEGRSITMPPLGRISVTKRKDRTDMDVLVLKLRRKLQVEDEPGADPLATAAE